jgi:UDP-N-acetylglucosamine--N-acetylmuramyl-(pentapeptide) pyrophosphoryl-undecaprenol N-acetylglucosamine transferase
MPVLLAAILLRIKRIILEPNAMPGMANQLLAPFVHLTVTAFPETEHLLRARKVACLGVPVRSEILSGSQKKDAGKPATLLVLGGSQGAHAINRAMIEALPFLAGQSITIIHQTGEKDWGIVKAAYEKHRINARVEKFIEKMAQVYAGSDLVVSRAGAGVLSELAVMGMPSLLIPFPYAKGHQAKNAEPFVACGAAEMILERDLIKEDARSAGGKLAERILNLFSHPEKLSEMGMAAKRLGHPDAADEIVSSCFELVEKGV